MNDTALPRVAAAPTRGGSRLVVVLRNKRFALPAEVVEAVVAPPPLARLPHARPAVLGVANLGGSIVPVLDLAALLGGDRGGEAYGTAGQVVRLRNAGGGVGLWVDRVERLLHANSAGSGEESPPVLDPTPLAVAGLAPPVLAPSGGAPLADALMPAPPAAAPAPQAFVVVEAAGKPVALPQAAVAELFEAVTWTQVPRAPDGFLGVAIVRGAALPVLSLGALLGWRDAAPTSTCVAVTIGSRRALLATDRLVGLRSQSEIGRVIEPARVISDELRHIVLGFPPADSGAELRCGATSEEATEYFAFAVGDQDCAVPIACVDRVVAAQLQVALPRPPGDPGNPAVEAAIELGGRAVPVAALRAHLGLGAAAPAAPPQAHVILRGADGLGAIAVDRLHPPIRLRPQEIAPPSTVEGGVIAGVAALPDHGLLRILVVERLWGGT